MEVFLRIEEGKDHPAVLREASLACTKEELDLLIAFLQDIQEELSDLDNTESEHFHFRDWSEGWSEKQSDFILFMAEKRQGK